MVKFDQDDQTINLHGKNKAPSSSDIDPKSIAAAYNKEFEVPQQPVSQPAPNQVPGRPVQYNAPQYPSQPQAQQSSANPYVQMNEQGLGVPVKSSGISTGLLSILTSPLIIPGYIFGIMTAMKGQKRQLPHKEAVLGIWGILLSSLFLVGLVIILLSSTTGTSITGRVSRDTVIGPGGSELTYSFEYPKNLQVSKNDSGVIEFQNEAGDFTVVFKEDFNKPIIDELSEEAIYESFLNDDYTDYLSKYVLDEDELSDIEITSVEDISGTSSRKVVSLNFTASKDDATIQGSVVFTIYEGYFYFIKILSPQSDWEQNAADASVIISSWSLGAQDEAQ